MSLHTTHGWAPRRSQAGPSRPDGIGDGPRLLERDLELSSIADALSKARAGSGSVVLLEGAPGLGKSATLAAAASAAERNGFEVLRGRGRALERELAFGLTLQLFERRVVDTGPRERDQLLSGAAGMAAPLLMREGRGVPESDDDALNTFHGLFWIALTLSQARPLAICVDDAELVDTPSLRLLLYLAERIDGFKTVVLAAAGPSRDPASHALLRQLATHPASSTLALRPLTRAAAAEQLRSSLPAHADDTLYEACHKATGGNPFLLKELAADIAATGIEPSAASVTELAPQSIAAATRVRLDALPGRALELARAAAVLDGDGEFGRVARLAGLAPGDATDTVSALCEADLLKNGGRVRFRHPIVRRALYADIPAVERAETHLAAAELLRRDGAPPALVAEHLLLARRGGEEWVVDALSTAAHEALANGVPEAAAGYLARALEEPLDTGQRGKLTLELGSAHAVAGHPEAAETLSEGIALVDDPAARVRAAIAAGSTLHMQGRSDDAEALLGAASGDADHVDGSLRARLAFDRALVARLGGDSIEGEPMLPIVQEHGPRHLRLAAEAFDRVLAGESNAEVRELATGALEGGTLLDAEGANSLPFYAAIFALTASDGLQAAEQALDDALVVARARGGRSALATAHHLRGQVLLRAGRLAPALADAREALSAVTVGWRGPAAHARAIVVSCLLELGDSDGAAHALELAATAPAQDRLSNAYYLASRAQWHLVSRRPQDALDDYTGAGSELSALGTSNPAILPWRLGAAAACVRLGRTAEARELVDVELALARRCGSRVAIGRAVGALGTLEVGRARLTALEEAVELLSGSPAMLDRAKALLELGGALRRSGRPKLARDPLRLALDQSERCGAVMVRQQAQSELNASGARPRRAALSGPASLTHRERQVAELAANGCSNREIADELFVTVKTVEWHLHNAYIKLEVPTRADLRLALPGGEPRHP